MDRHERGIISMFRFALVGSVILMLTSAAAAEEVDGPVLVDLFANTCMRRPALPSELDRIASQLGFISEHGPISAEMESGSKIDILYFAKLMVRGEKVSLSAYFTGPVDAPTVSCKVGSLKASTDRLPELVEQSVETYERSDEVTADGNRLEVKWRLGAADSGDTLELRSYQDPVQRASITINYLGGKR
jgi:hypothetical protein